MFYACGSFLYTPRHDTRIFIPTENLDFISTGFELTVPNDLREIKPLLIKKIKLLRDKVDPLGI